jgi:voltage-gated potassium channel Kch
MKKFRWVIFAVLIIAILAVTVPVVIGCNYTYMCEDDFATESGAQDAAAFYGSNFIGALHKVHDYAMTNQGTYVPTFLLHFVRAYSRWGFTGFHAVMILNAVFFILALLLLIKALLKDNYSTLLLLLAATISAFSVVGTDSDKELFFWYTGALTYTLELSLAFITLAFCILFKNTTDPVKRRICLIISMVSGFIASGGSLEVTAPNCAWLLLLLILCRQEVKKQKILIWPFIISFAGALINVLAPGNFVRANNASNAGHVTLADAIRDTFTCYHDETAAIFGSALFVVVLAAVFIICILCRTKIFRNGISNARILLLVPAVFLIQYFTMFPVVFGYHSTSLISLRTTGTYEIVARFMYLFYTVCLAQWCSEHLKTKVTAAVPMVTAAVIAIIVFAASGSKGQDFTNGFTGEICQIIAVVP